MMSTETRRDLAIALTSRNATVPPWPNDCACGLRMEFCFLRPDDESDPGAYRSCACGLTAGGAR